MPLESDSFATLVHPILIDTTVPLLERWQSNDIFSIEKTPTVKTGRMLANLVHCLVVRVSECQIRYFHTQRRQIVAPFLLYIHQKDIRVTAGLREQH